MTCVFVYGTLRTGGSNAFRMAGARSRGTATVPGELYRIDPEFPGLILRPDSAQRVTGELFENVSRKHLEALDDYEGCGPRLPVEKHLYRRLEKKVFLKNEEEHAAWLWEYLPIPPPMALIESGDWFTKG